MRASLMRPKWLELISLAKIIYTLYIFNSLVHPMLPKYNPSKNIFDFTTTADMHCVAAIEHLTAIHYSVNFISLPFGIMDSIVEPWNH